MEDESLSDDWWLISIENEDEVLPSPRPPTPPRPWPATPLALNPIEKNVQTSAPSSVQTVLLSPQAPLSPPSALAVSAPSTRTTGVQTPLELVFSLLARSEESNLFKKQKRSATCTNEHKRNPKRSRTSEHQQNPKRSRTNERQRGDNTAYRPNYSTQRRSSRRRVNYFSTHERHQPQLFSGRHQSLRLPNKHERQHLNSSNERRHNGCSSWRKWQEPYNYW